MFPREENYLWLINTGMNKLGMTMTTAWVELGKMKLDITQISTQLEIMLKAGQ